MNKRTIVLHYAIGLLLGAAALAASHFNAVRLSEQATAAYRQEQADRRQKDIDAWQDHLGPVYADFGVEAADHPQTYGELFGPMIGLLQEIQN